MTINTTFGEILEAGGWTEFCEDRGYSPWIMNEGLASPDEHVELTVEEARKYGLTCDSVGSNA